MDILRPYMSLSDEAEFETIVDYNSKFDDEIETLILSIYYKHDKIKNALNKIEELIYENPELEDKLNLIKDELEY